MSKLSLLPSPLFALTVLIPSIIASAYFGFIASDVYISESRFVVRSPDAQTTTPLGTLFRGAGITDNQSDSYTVRDYSLSRDALKAVDDEIGFRQAYSSNQIDMLSRFNGFGLDDSFESLHRYYQKRIDVRLDTVSSISTLTTRAFTPETAEAINRRLLDHSEQLVNSINVRARQDMIRFAAEEVILAESKAKESGLALARYRNDMGVIDPEKQTSIPLQQIAKLQDELFVTRSLIAQFEGIAINNPQLPGLRQRVNLLENRIQEETMRIVGSGDLSLASMAAEYHRLSLEKEFADRVLASALTSLEQAKSEAQRKQIYLDRIVQPSLPDEAMEPRRMRGILSTLLLGLIVFGILKMLLAGIREHSE